MQRHICTNCGKKIIERSMIKGDKYGNGYKWFCINCAASPFALPKHYLKNLKNKGGKK